MWKEPNVRLVLAFQPIRRMKSLEVYAPNIWKSRSRPSAFPDQIQPMIQAMISPTVV